MPSVSALLKRDGSQQIPVKDQHLSWDIERKSPQSHR